MVSINRESKLLLPRVPLEQTTLECVKESVWKCSGPPNIEAA